jgi:hypothetical protein
VRLGQDLGLHVGICPIPSLHSLTQEQRSPEKLRLPEMDRQRRRSVWFCLYILDRSLAMSLGRPLAINDLDCDIEIPDHESTEYQDAAGFFALVELHRLSGEVMTTTSSVRQAKACRETAGGGALRAKIDDLSTRLRRWAGEVVPPHIRSASTGR